MKRKILLSRLDDIGIKNVIDLDNITIEEEKRIFNKVNEKYNIEININKIRGNSEYQRGFFYSIKFHEQLIQHFGFPKRSNAIISSLKKIFELTTTNK